MTAETPARHVALEGCCNFRDLGGYQTTDGRRTRWRTLFRADGLSQLSPSDLRQLVELRVRTVVDLRTALEVEARGRFPAHAEGVTYHHLPLTDTLPGAEEVAAWDDAGWVARRYAGYLEADDNGIADALDILARAENLPAVFHCSVGKDRTGVLAALVLGFLGIPDQLIVDDYVLSARAMVKVVERLEAEFPDSSEVARYAPVILSVAPESMAGFLAEVRSRHGSWDALAASLGVEATVERLRQTLLEPV